MAAALGMTGTALARGNPALKAARDACRAERQQIGGKAFRQKYGPKPMTACITQHGVTPPTGHRHRGDNGDRHNHRGRHGNDQGGNGGDNQGNGGGD